MQESLRFDQESGTASNLYRLIQLTENIEEISSLVLNYCQHFISYKNKSLP